MKLKSIIKLSSAVRCDIRIFDENDYFIEDFKIDYITMSSNDLGVVLANKYFKYENCKVRHIDVRTKSDGTSWLVIYVTI